MPCRVAVPRAEIESHLRVSHKEVKCKDRRALVGDFKDLPIANTAANLRLLPDGSPPLSFLKPPKAGFFCPICPTFKTVSWYEARRHAKMARSQPLKPSNRGRASCFLQR